VAMATNVWPKLGLYFSLFVKTVKNWVQQHRRLLLGHSVAGARYGRTLGCFTGKTVLSNWVILLNGR
jgi:hypothetical protein